MQKLLNPMREAYSYAAYAIIGSLLIALPAISIDVLHNPTQSGKFFVFICGVLFVAVLFTLKNVLFGYAVIINLIDVLGIFLLAFITLNRFYIPSSYNFKTSYCELLALGVVYVVIRKIHFKSYYFFFVCIILGGIVQAVHGQLQLFDILRSNHVLFKPTGGFFNPGPYAGYLASAYPVGLGFFLIKFKVQQGDKLQFISPDQLSSVVKLLSIMGIGFILLVIPSTHSRAGWLAVLCSSFYLMYRKGRFNSTADILHFIKGKRAIVIILTMSAILVIFASFLFKKDSASGRLLIWKITADMVMKKPLLGEGYAGFNSAYMNHQAAYFKAHNNDTEKMLADDVIYAYNEFLQFTVENGIPISIFVLTTVFLLLNVKKYKSTHPGLAHVEAAGTILVIAKAGLISVLVFSFFSYPSDILPIKINATIFVAILSNGFKPLAVFNPTKFKGRISLLLQAFLVFLIFLLTSMTVYYLVKMYKAYRDWQTATELYASNSPQESEKYYLKAYPVFSKEGTFLTQFGKALSVNNKYSRAELVLKRAELVQNSYIVQTALGDTYKGLKKYELAENAYTSASWMIPNRFYPHYLLAKLYYEDGQKEKAILAAKKVLTKEVKIQSLAIEEMRQEMRVLIKAVDK